MNGPFKKKISHKVHYWKHNSLITDTNYLSSVDSIILSCKFKTSTHCSPGLRVYCFSDKFQDIRVFIMKSRHFYPILFKANQKRTFRMWKNKRRNPYAAKIKGKKYGLSAKISTNI